MVFKISNGEIQKGHRRTCRPHLKIILNGSESRFMCTYAIFSQLAIIKYNCETIGDETSHSKIPDCKCVCDCVYGGGGGGGRGCSYKQVMFSYHKF